MNDIDLVRPFPIKEFSPKSIKLLTKSSLEAKSIIACVIMLFEAFDHPASLIVSEANGNTSVRIHEDCIDRVFSFCSDILTNKQITRDNLTDKLNSNPLVNALLEHIENGLSYIWKLAWVEFVDSNINAANERTGRRRYPKRIYFSSRMDIISSIISGSDKNAYIETLLSWIGLNQASTNEDAEYNLCRILSVFSEEAVFEFANVDPDGIRRFNKNGIYRALVEMKNVDISDIDSNNRPDKRGPLRILSNAIEKGLNPYIRIDRSGPVVVSDGKYSQLMNYNERVETFMSLRYKLGASIQSDLDIFHDGITGYGRTCAYQRNMIYFGAPGTGKSYKLNLDKDKLLETHKNNFERVTFYADYSYSQFVGAYKPTMSDDKIIYSFVPGPFLRVLIKAYQNIIDATLPNGDIDVNKVEPFIMIIEELNRAEAATVFGDFFQLLDRDDNNRSEYQIQTSEDIRNYLSKCFDCSRSSVSTIRFPDNLFIWATMNSADQGVFALDTAFKRRWGYAYLGIDDGELFTDNDGNVVFSQSDDFSAGDVNFKWNTLRRAINARLSSSDIRAHEDKLLGPYFMKVLNKDRTPIFFGIDKNNNFIDAFNQKVLMYLFEDVAKSKRKELFKGCSPEIYNRYSLLCHEFAQKGPKIFGDNFMSSVYKDQEEIISKKISEMSK